ncbi:uncharacterized protein LOC101856901 [Aplysia californica]|uniref:Uncharacterized protein LOC101856901 n=1 Tax=Aplysia californica TaxID=6500 RepID=A0ABM1A161_APLCA|nr:uncharacterized protein LOC101856901 [Aplysia californica]
MALVLLPVAITIASLSVPALWARHCSQSESRVFYANAGHVTSFWDAVQTCSRLNGFLAEFPTPADDTTLTYVNKTAVAPYEPLVVGAVSFGSTSVFRWYTSGEIVEKIGDVDSAMNVSRSAGTEGEKKCFFLMGGRLGRGVCEGWEPQLVHALCQINLHEKKFLTGACTLCMCPGMSRPQCRKTVCGWPCAELIETTTCEYYPCRSNKT